MLNTPRELTHFPIPGSNINLPRPKGTRLVARRLNAEDSAALRQVMNRGPVACRCPDGSTQRVSVRRLGRTTGKARVVIPMKADAYQSLITGLRAGRPVAVAVPAGVGGARMLVAKGAK